MTKDEFLSAVGDAIEAEAPLEVGKDLADYPTWDSLGILAVIDLFEEIGAEVDIDTLSSIATTDELIGLAGTAVNG